MYSLELVLRGLEVVVSTCGGLAGFFLPKTRGFQNLLLVGDLLVEAAEQLQISVVVGYIVHVKRLISITLF